MTFLFLLSMPMMTFSYRATFSGTLDTIKVNTFEHINHTKTLYIKNNFLSTIKADAFKNLKQLSSLYFEANTVHDTEHGPFRHLSSLTYLYLESVCFLKKSEISTMKTSNNKKDTAHCKVKSNCVAQFFADLILNLTETLNTLILRKTMLCRVEEGTFFTSHHVGNPSFGKHLTE